MLISQNTDYYYTSDDTKIHKSAILVDCEIGKKCIIAPFVIINKDCKIDDNSIIGPYNVLERSVSVGKNVTLGPHGVYAIDTIIGDNCFFGPHFSCANDKDISYGEHGTSPKKLPFVEYPITFGKGCTIGTRCTIAPGVTIGQGSRLDMCCFITKNVKPFSHMRGTNELVAKLIRTMDTRPDEI